MNTREQMESEATAKTWTKPISQARDRQQSQWLCLVAGTLLALSGAVTVGAGLHRDTPAAGLLPLSISIVFSLAAWRLRAATPSAALAGGLICFQLTARTGKTLHDPIPSALTPLLLLFVLTFAATRAGKQRKQHSGLAEGRRGRTASQVIANLGAAALCGNFVTNSSSYRAGAVLVLAALIEATADTVSSEIGQAFGGQPRMLTSLQRVPPGTDGAVTVLGTVTGVAAGAAVAASGAWAMALGMQCLGIAVLAGVAGLFLDSWLGATVERRGWLGNDLVNFSSTVFSVAVAWLLLARLGV